ncbi:cytochrome c oxidase subunit II [Pelagibacterium sp. 26DY04]|uniref:cytochrome c oxidase subunit II n=1 Tax=unclassified Pelagibacterium TaxID=2623280 RepID=UPI0028156627|nr:MULTISPECIES: cytochrome c oxidase subunit II [unclassified Pelagibacterium]WMT87836.1 cytochrome c oxidase subunit II [Pelagibacterium sp. 26DY04]WMT91397.1 cytochrome c oxidase subunit II [Pelagibacterium sp. H642]
MTGFSFRLVRASLAALLFALIPAIASAQEAGHAVPGQIGLQPSVTPIMDSIIAFHDNLLMWIITAIVLVVLALLIVVIVRFNQRANPVPSKVTHNTLVEVVWTVVPVLLLFVIAIPSFGVLADQQTIPDGERRYLGSQIFGGDLEVPAPELTIKVTGYQWYWGYEYMDQDVDFVSVMLNEEQRAEQKPDQPRLLAVDNELIVPVNTTVRLLVTAADVLHAFAVPSFGIKTDAVTSRNNETWFNARETGIYYGQCSELCGKDHAFMPIAVRVVEQEQFDAWLAAAQEGSLADANSTLLASIE